MYKRILERNPFIKTANILIVDDNEVSRIIIEKFFRDEGFSNIKFATDGSMALNLAQSSHPDIIIGDIFMPNMDGFEFIKKLREMEEFDHIPVIIQTTATSNEDITKAYQLGASDVISKPVDKLVLLSRAIFHIENVLFRKRIEKELDAARTLQNSIVPSKNEIKSIEEKYNLQTATYFSPCSEIGGDFWGFKDISHAELGVYTVDISGHGVAAALNAFSLQSILKDQNSFFSSTNLCLKKLNKKMTGLVQIGQFATMFYGVINFAENFIQYSSAASPEAIIIRAKGNVDLLKATGLPLGVEPNAEYSVFKTRFEKGDALILYSDALIETPDKSDKFFTQEQINNSLKKSGNLSAKEILDQLLKDFKEHIEKISIVDDLTINIYKRL